VHPGRPLNAAVGAAMRLPADETTSLLVRTAFDIAAWLVAALVALLVARSGRVAFPVEPQRRLSYYAALVTGAAAGAYLFGTLNLWMSGVAGVARSIEGALAGAIFAAEGYKRFAGISARTGARFALPLAVGIAVGRLGCFFAGLLDFTYGTPTRLPWGVDFGDGIARHPVQLYESLAMAAFAAAYVWAFRTGSRTIVERGFYLCVGFYGAQRFVWEFLKPYGAVLGPFTIFHLLSAFLVVYAIVMLASNPHEMERERTARHSLGP
jgi:phosphatidylglycerol---prolipoprotein diacylglyceryl transferase